MAEPLTSENIRDEIWNISAKIIDGPYTEFLVSIQPVIYAGVRDNFNSQASPDNVDWVPRGFHGAFFSGVSGYDDGHPLLMKTGSLMQAAVGSGSGAIADVGTHEILVGIDGGVIPYAAAQNYGRDDINLPAREFFGLSEERIDQIEEMLVDWIQENIFGEEK